MGSAGILPAEILASKFRRAGKTLSPFLPAINKPHSDYLNFHQKHDSTYRYRPSACYHVLMPDILSAAEINRGLAAAVIGRNVLYFDRLASTNDTAREEARHSAPEGTVVVAGVQEQGRGRLQRRWEAPEGNIALSIVLYPPTERLPYLTMMASLAVCHAIRDITGLEAGIKWPNDVLISSKKVCGILIENELHPDGRAVAVVGIGVNARLQPEQYRDFATAATSLEAEAGKPVSRVDIIRAVLAEFDSLYISTDDQQTFRGWRESLVTLGQPVTATWKNGSVEGMAEDVEETGALVIRLADGTLQTVVTGDVTLRKNP